MRAVIAVTLALAIWASPVTAQRHREKPPMPAGYDEPGPAPDNPLPKIVNALRSSLKDPYSIRDFTMCPPSRIEAYYGIDWVRARWNIKITLNAKNSYGGYMGSMMFDVAFENGEVTQVRQFKGIDLITPDQNAKLIAMARECPRIPDADIQKLLSD